MCAYVELVIRVPLCRSPEHRVILCLRMVFKLLIAVCSRVCLDVSLCDYEEASGRMKRESKQDSGRGRPHGQVACGLILWPTFEGPSFPPPSPTGLFYLI